MPENTAVPEGVPPDRTVASDSAAPAEKDSCSGNVTASRGLSIDWSSGSEEPWEAQISLLLSSLPPVEPPPGFLESLAMNGPRIAAPFTLEVDSPFAFPVVENDAE